jgi:enoyl-CoA hydratase/carnithine racemase
MAIRDERRDHIGIVTIDRPERRNALDAEHSLRMSQILDEWEVDHSLWVVIVTGAGDQAFCAGADLKARQATAAPETGARPASRLPGWKGFGGITHREYPKPIIAAVNGLAFGGGFELCLACDLVVAEEHVHFALPEVKRGLVAGAGGPSRLVRALPPVVAAEFVLTGEPISAARALELGLINRLVPKGAGVDSAVALGEQICQNAPLAVSASKRLMRRSLRYGEDTMTSDTWALIDEVTASEDTREGIAAFTEKRAPRWTGH